MTAAHLPPDCSDCPIALQVARSLDSLDKKIDDLTSAIARQDAALQVHIARHMERESMTARTVQWTHVIEQLVTWGSIIAISMMALFALLHSGAVLKFFGVTP